MENQDHKKNHPPGHDSHGAHVCNKCGWPFPNPHPSAKNRRAHKKICGTIEGYKLAHSEGSTHSNISDDEHQSDEDHKTPSLRMLERSNNEKGSGAIGDRSGRSEDEVFSDAIAEFPDSGGSGKGIEESSDEYKKPKALEATIAYNDTRNTLLNEDVATVTVTIPPPSNSADSSHMESTEVQGSSLSRSAQDSQNIVPSVTTDFVARSLSGYRTDESVFESSDYKAGSTVDSNPIQLGNQIDEIQKNYEKNFGENVVESDAKGNEETQNQRNNSSDAFVMVDTKAIEKTNLDRPSLDVEVSPGDVGETSETFSKLGKLENKTSDSVPDAGAIQLKEQFNDKLDYGIPLDSISSEVESVEHTNSSIDTSSQLEVDAFNEVGSGGSGNLIETRCGDERERENVYVLSIPGDIPVVENAEAMIRGFKDLEGGRLPKLVDVGSLELSNEVKESVLKDDVPSICSGQPYVGIEVSVSDMHVLEGSFEETSEKNDHIIEKFPDETEHDMPEVKVITNESQRTEEFGAPTYPPGSEVEKICAVQCCEEQPSHCQNSPQASSLEHATKVLIDVYPVDTAVDAEVWQLTNVVGVDNAGDDEKKRVTNVLVDPSPVAATMDTEVGLLTNVVGMDNSGDDEKTRVERHDIAENEEGKLIKEESFVGNVIATSTTDTVKSYYASETETGKGGPTLESMEGNHSVKAPMPESADDLQDNFVTSENVINAPERNLLKPEIVVADNQEGEKELKSNGSRSIQMEHARVGSTAELDKVGDNDELQIDNIGDDALQKSSEHVTKVPQPSSLDTSTSVQNCATVGDNPARDFVGVSSENQSKSLPDRGENKLVTQQLGASATDLSVDSGSQTDSLEGHWGSVSVLSTQSDMPAIVDTEPLASGGPKASSEAEKNDLWKPKALPDGQQHSDKSDIFEPPSFMTLVEPRGGDKATASEIQTAQNMQQPKAASLQAGWFPSLTHVVNESQGRKKNEEIIAKVTNWSTGKQHTPLKNLLGEANTGAKSKLTNAKDNPVPVVQKDDTSIKDISSSPATANSTVGAQMPVAESVKKDTGKEWNSPARYPADIKREKRKVKGRPYWAQFVCCSSVN